MRRISYHNMWHAAGSCGNRPCTKSYAYVCLFADTKHTHICAYEFGGCTLSSASGSAYAATFNYSSFGGEQLTPGLPYPTAYNVIYCRSDHSGLQWVNLLSELSSTNANTYIHIFYRTCTHHGLN